MHTVYRHFDKTGVLLYVGRSFTPLARQLAHKDRSAWFCEIARIELAHFETKEKAQIEEAKAIAREGPVYNLAPGALPKREKGRGKKMNLTKEEALARIEEMGRGIKKAPKGL